MQHSSIQLKLLLEGTYLFHVVLGQAGTVQWILEG